MFDSSSVPLAAPEPKAAAQPGPVGLAAVVLVVLAVSVVVLLHQERAYELDPQLRARAGLVDGSTDIALTRPAGFRTALAAIAERLPPGGRISGLSVAPGEISATLVAASGAQRYVKVIPGGKVSSYDMGDRVSIVAGVLPLAIPVAAPERIIRVAERRFGLRPQEVQRLFLDAATRGHAGGWSVRYSQPTDDAGLVAAVDGTDVRRPGTPARGGGR